MCRPNAEPSLCTTPRPYGPPLLDFLWPDIDPSPQTEFRSAHGWAGQLKVLTLTWPIACALHSRDTEDCKERKMPFESRVWLWCRGSGGIEVCTSNVVHSGEFCESSHWWPREAGGRLELQHSPATTAMPFASKHQTWIGLDTGGRSPGGTKPPWACPQERQRWLSLTHGGSQGAPKGALRTQTRNKTSCPCYPRQKSTPLVNRAVKGKIKPE